MMSLSVEFLFNGTNVIAYKEEVNRIYFIDVGKVSVFDRRTTWKILSYLEGSYFGDIQVLLGVKSNYCY